MSVDRQTDRQTDRQSESIASLLFLLRAQCNEYGRIDDAYNISFCMLVEEKYHGRFGDVCGCRESVGRGKWHWYKWKETKTKYFLRIFMNKKGI